VHAVQLAYAHSTRTVFYIMAGVLAATFVVALRGFPKGRVERALAGVAEPGEVTRRPVPEGIGLPDR
jgi:hypothetical protein